MENVRRRLITPIAIGTVFLSSFLLFIVQPLVSKHLLPWFGGSAQVWVTVSVFFMVCLLFGYGYVVALNRLHTERQLRVHLVVLLCVVMWLLYGWFWGGSGIVHPLTDVATERPVWSLLLSLLTLCAVPAVVSATTSSLVQVWYGHATEKNPYALYVVSNAGSLLGLLAYPIVVEPYLSVAVQGLVWTVGYIVFALCMAVTIWCVSEYTKSATVDQLSEKVTVTFLACIQWLLLAGVPVLTMLLVTTHITSFLLPVPFVWVLPLALYLVSFMVSFRTHAVVVSWWWYLSLCIALVAFLVSVTMVVLPPLYQAALMLVVMMLVFHVCHELLYGRRPVVSAAPIFYAMISVGGVLSGVVALLIPLLFPRYAIEMYALAGSGVLLTVYALCRSVYPAALWQRVMVWVVASVSLLVVLVVAGLLLHFFQTNAYEQSLRNFYGHKQVTADTIGDREIRSMIHGRTVHGTQVAGLAKPTSYYVASSGVGQVLHYMRAYRAPAPLRVAVVGLGVGTLASYCQSGDTFDFYEIDPQVVALARSEFVFLDHCPGATVTVKDARQALVTTDAVYDVVVIDAYADDSVPAHLLTVQAIALYQSRLTDDGIIAIHSSSRYLDLQPVFTGYVSALPLLGRRFQDLKPFPDGTVSDWSVFTGVEQTHFDQPVFADFEPVAATTSVVWTDTYNALWPIIR